MYRGWIPHAHRAGQTMGPMYIACGISGAIQHGMPGSDVTVAINEDPTPPSPTKRTKTSAFPGRPPFSLLFSVQKTAYCGAVALAILRRNKLFI